MELVTKAEFARRQGVSRAAVGKWVNEGRIVIVDDRVDVEASNALLAALRHPRAIMRAEQRAKAAAGIVAMTPASISQSIAKLDWNVQHDWTDAGIDARARKAAECIGWEAVTSDLRDDGHWGGYQLREQAMSGRSAIIDGFGFELTALEVILICRDEIEPDDEDGDFKISVRPDLFSALALPHWSSQSASTQNQ